MDTAKMRPWLRRGIAAAGMVLSAVAVAQLLLRQLSRFLAFSPQFAAIFAQLRHARMYTPWLLATAVALLFCLGADTLRKRSRLAFGAAVAGGAVLWLGMILAAVLYTFVNGMLFGDILFSLLDVLGKGGLDL